MSHSATVVLEISALSDICTQILCGRTSRRLAESSGEIGEVRASRSSRLRMAAAKTREGEAPAEPLNWSAYRAVANILAEQQGCGSAGASPSRCGPRPEQECDWAHRLRSGETVDIVALRVHSVAGQVWAVRQRQSLCLESYPVRVADDGKGWRGRRVVNCGRDVDSCGVRPPRNEVTSHVCYRFRQFCSASPEIQS
jgi:hypothetical protein